MVFNMYIYVFASVVKSLRLCLICCLMRFCISLRHSQDLVHFVMTFPMILCLSHYYFVDCILTSQERLHVIMTCLKIFLRLFLRLSFKCLMLLFRCVVARCVNNRGVVYVASNAEPCTYCRSLPARVRSHYMHSDRRGMDEGSGNVASYCWDGFNEFYGVRVARCDYDCKRDCHLEIALRRRLQRRCFCCWLC